MGINLNIYLLKLELRWRKRSFWLELPNRLRDSTTWSLSCKRPSMLSPARTSPSTRGTCFLLDSRTSSDPREVPFVPLAPSSKIQSTRSLVMLLPATRRRSRASSTTSACLLCRLWRESASSSPRRTSPRPSSKR